MSLESTSRLLKYRITKFLGWPDNGRSIAVFENMVEGQTWAQHDAVLTEAEAMLSNKEKNESDAAYQSSNDPLVRQGYELKKKVCAGFKNRYAGEKTIRVLIHTPTEQQSPGGYSHAHNFQQAFSFMGIPCELLSFASNLEKALNTFQPTLFLTVDSTIYVKDIDWQALARYRASRPTDRTLRLGLVAQPLEWKEKMPERITWAKTISVDFYYAFHDPDFIAKDSMYKPILDDGFNILSLPFGANILTYYPVPNIVRDLDYVFLASLGGAKSEQYIQYLGTIVKKYRGFIDGPGWRHASHFSFKPERDRYVYAQARVGINIHIASQRNSPSETNERTFMLAACGVPQITDRAKILSKLFSEGALFIADSPRDYLNYFTMIMNDPTIGRDRALQAQKEVFEKHTTFHRVDDFIKDFRERVKP